MRRSIYAAFAAALILAASLSCPAADEPPATTLGPQKLTLAVLLVADTNASEFVFSINNRVAFKTIDSLRKFLADQPAGSTLTWDPGCERLDGQPLGKTEEMAAFQKFCTDHKIEMIIIPAG